MSLRNDQAVYVTHSEKVDQRLASHEDALAKQRAINAALLDYLARTVAPEFCEQLAAALREAIKP